MQCNMTKDNLKTELPAGVDKKIKPNLEIMTFEFGKNKRELQRDLYLKRKFTRHYKHWQVLMRIVLILWEISLEQKVKKEIY